MLKPPISPQRAGRDGAAQLQLVRRYARLLREGAATTATVRRAGASRTTATSAGPRPG